MWSGTDDEIEEILYKCKFCPGQTFNAAQRDEHRAKHRQERISERSNKRHDQYVASKKIYAICSWKFIIDFCVIYRSGPQSCSLQSEEEVVVLEEIIKTSGPRKSSSPAGSKDGPVGNLRARRSLETPDTFPTR